MEEELIYENEDLDIAITSERITVDGKAIPASTAECYAVYSSSGFFSKKNEFFIAYSVGNNVFKQRRRIDYSMTIKSDKAELLKEYDVSLYSVSTKLSKSEMDILQAAINGAIEKARL